MSNTKSADRSGERSTPEIKYETGRIENINNAATKLWRNDFTFMQIERLATEVIHLSEQATDGLAVYLSDLGELSKKYNTMYKKINKEIGLLEDARSEHIISKCGDGNNGGEQIGRSVRSSPHDQVHRSASVARPRRKRITDDTRGVCNSEHGTDDSDIEHAIDHDPLDLLHDVSHEMKSMLNTASNIVSDLSGARDGILSAAALLTQSMSFYSSIGATFASDKAAASTSSKTVTPLSRVDKVHYPVTVTDCDLPVANLTPRSEDVPDVSFSADHDTPGAATEDYSKFDDDSMGISVIDTKATVSSSLLDMMELKSKTLPARSDVSVSSQGSHISVPEVDVQRGLRSRRESNASSGSQGGSHRTDSGQGRNARATRDSPRDSHERRRNRQRRRHTNDRRVLAENDRTETYGDGATISFMGTTHNGDALSRRRNGGNRVRRRSNARRGPLSPRVTEAHYSADSAASGGGSGERLSRVSRHARTRRTSRKRSSDDRSTD